MRRELLVITNLYGFPWDPNRGVFNRQQFEGIAANETSVRVLVAVPWADFLRHARAYLRYRPLLKEGVPEVHYFVYWYTPRIAYRLHPLFFFLSLLASRPLLVLRRKYDCIIGSWLFPDSIAACWVGRLTSTPVIVKAHGSDVNLYMDIPERRSRILGSIARCAGVLCVSGELKAKLGSFGVLERKMQIIYNGVNEKRFIRGSKTDARKALGIREEVKLILYVGNLKESKGVADLLQAAFLLHDQGSDFEYVFIGDSSDRQSYIKLVEERGLAGRIRFNGKAAHEALPRWYVAADLLCLPSHAEGVPNVILESMSCGTPVVATRVGGIPEILPDFAGEMVLPRDAAALARSLKAVANRSWDHEKISQHASHFNWNRNTSEVKSMIESVCLP